MTSTGPQRFHSPPTSVAVDPNTPDADAVHTRRLDELVRRVFAAGLALRAAAEASSEPEVIVRLEQIGIDLDATIQDVWSGNFGSVVPLGPSR